MPTVSVCIPSYNAESYIESAVESVRDQTFDDWELIVVDDCSTDRTRILIESLLERTGDGRITVHVNSARVGMAGNWNKAVAFASGDFVKILCHDDLLTPDCLEAQVKAMRSNPRVCLVASGRTILTARGRRLFIRRSFKADGVYRGRDVVDRSMRAGTNIIGEPSAVLIRRATFHRVGGFRESVLYYTDLDLWLRLLLHGDLYFISAPKASFRLHGRSATRSLESEMLTDYFRVVDSVGRETLTHLGSRERAWVAVKVRALNAMRRALYRGFGDG